MTVVLDASAIMPLAMEDEDATVAELVVRRIQAEGGLVPALFWYEIRNVLSRAEQKSRRTVALRSEFLDVIDALSLRVDFPPPSDALFELAAKHSLTIYDAAYLELALRHTAALATNDHDLAKAATIEKLEVLSRSL